MKRDFMRSEFDTDFNNIFMRFYSQCRFVLASSRDALSFILMMSICWFYALRSSTLLVVDIICVYFFFYAFAIAHWEVAKFILCFNLAEHRQKKKMHGNPKNVIQFGHCSILWLSIYVYRWDISFVLTDRFALDVCVNIFKTDIIPTTKTTPHQFC